MSIEGSFETVVHLAARAHVLKETSQNPEAEFLKFNRDVTLTLAKQMAEKGMKRFVFISSIGVNGAETIGNECFSEQSQPKPTTLYGKSKYAAEVELKKLCLELGFELVIIRPPLVYGNDAPGNFGKLVGLVGKKLPLPFGMVNNNKSYVSVTNLADFIVLCCTHKKAAGETFLVADDDFISTKNLIKEIGKAINVSVVMLPIPKSILTFLLDVIGKQSMAVQLLSDLKVDNTKAKNLLGWKPIETTKQSLNRITLTN
jgi:nucleoside-diphosphate-sugar epimerase